MSDPIDHSYHQDYYSRNRTRILAAATLRRKQGAIVRKCIDCGTTVPSHRPGRKDRCPPCSAKHRKAFKHKASIERYRILRQERLRAWQTCSRLECGRRFRGRKRKFCSAHCLKAATRTRQVQLRERLSTHHKTCSCGTEFRTRFPNKKVCSERCRLDRAAALERVRRADNPTRWREKQRRCLAANPDKARAAGIQKTMRERALRFDLQLQKLREYIDGCQNERTDRKAY